MNNETTRLLDLVGLSKSFCELCERAREYSKEEFTDRALDLLPRIYWNFFDLSAGVALGEADYFSDYVDESLYDQIRGSIASVMGGADTFLETFEEDMKYSDTPITSSISECLADLFQPLFNFISIVHDSEGSQLEEAFISCKEDFENYWSQTLCNALKALNNVKYNHLNEEEDYG
ncbi:MAG: DUF5063 domain-containing protein [Muribaculaceae bacterium]|nr:DUF5063 domain-containing protein [Muribaculaceae bacterium]